MLRMRWRLLVFLLPAAVASCGGNYNWGWYVVLPTTKQGSTNIQFLLGGLWTTISLSLLAIAISVLIGLLVALPGLSTNAGWRRFNRIYVELFRAIPILVMLLWVYYGLPTLFEGFTLSVFWAGLVALALGIDTAFVASHHVIRIMMVIGIAPILFGAMNKGAQGKPPD